MPPGEPFKVFKVCGKMPGELLFIAYQAILVMGYDYGNFFKRHKCFKVTGLNQVHLSAKHRKGHGMDAFINGPMRGTGMNLVKLWDRCTRLEITQVR